MTRIGVYVCHCGTNIAATVDVEKVRDYASKLPNVVLARDYAYMCSEPGQDLIKEDIRNEKLDRVIVASCTPRMHEPTFRKTCEIANLNPYCLEMVNIREQCSWTHSNGTEKAMELIRMKVMHASYLRPLERLRLPVVKKGLVIGGGIAGIQAALSMAEEGFEVYLIEKSPTIGGHMAQLDKTFPTLDCSACILTPKMVEVSSHDNINLITYAEPVSVDGYVGNFKVKVKKKPRYVDEDECTGCGECEKVCPITVYDEFDLLGERKAIYIPFPQAVPSTYTIDKEKCKGCGLCEVVCEAEAIDLGQKEEEIELDVGTIIVAIGYDLLDPIPEKYGYEYDEVITGLELERLFSPSGPTGGKIDEERVRSVVFIQCVGSRGDLNQHCSRICCMYTAKHALLIKEKIPDADVTVLYTDVRAFGKGYEEFYDRVKKDGVVYKRRDIEDPIEVTKENDEILVKAETVDGYETLEADLVVLAPSLIPSGDTSEIAGLLNLSQKTTGFFMEAHPKLRPMDSFVYGIFMAGCCQSPKDVPDTVAQANGAASRACSILSKKEIEIEPVFCALDERKCIKCGLCVDMCPYDALALDDKLTVNEILCKGCGACVAACPTGALSQNQFEDAQLISEIKSLFAYA